MNQYEKEIEADDLESFILRAQRQIYLGKGTRLDSDVSKLHGYKVEQSPYVLHQWRSGYYQMQTMTIAYQHEQPVWMSHMMGLLVKISAEADRASYRMLIKILAGSDSSEHLFRGPRVVTLGKWRYTYAQEGDLEHFFGEERLLYENEVMFKGRVQGGKIIHK